MIRILVTGCINPPEGSYLQEADEIHSKSKANAFQFPEDEDEPPVKRKQSNMEKSKAKVRSGLTDRKENEPLVQKTRMKKTGTRIQVVHLSVDSDSDDKKEVVTEADGRQSNSKVDTFQFPEDDEDGQFSACESGDEDEPPVKWKQSSMEKTKEKVRPGSIDRKVHDPLVHKSRMKKMDKGPTNELSNIGHQKRKKAINIDRDTMGELSGLDRYTRVDKSSSDEHEKSNKGSSKDDGGSLDAILDSNIANEGVQGKKYVSSYTYRFDVSENESKSQTTDEFGAEGLFEEMKFELEFDEMGSYRDSTVEKHEKDKNISPIDLCRRGEHGDFYFEEQTGYRCCACGAVILETKDTISKHATYAPDKSKRSYRFDEYRVSSSENLYPEGADSNSPDIMCHETRGTVWELIPTSIRSHLYPHQRQAFKFLWENLVGTIEFSELQKLGSRGGGGCGGCIISHAPGTGKTLLAIVFVDTFLKIFSRCCPVIVAPASTLLTWEAESKKWPVGFSFINISSSRHNKDSIRAIKIRSWSNGGSVLGISYNLYTKLAGILNTKNKRLEKMRNILLDMPGLVVLDEGHTPRNQESNIWNTLLKLKTKNRVILSGTPFQNNFRELFNTLRLVRPEIVKGKIFSDMIRQNMKRSGSRSTCEDVEKISKIISPFVHVHKGHILESKLPGLKEIVILLDPPAIQKSLIENLENMTTSFEYEHKVALVSVHPSLILHWSLSEKEEKLVNKQELEKMRRHPHCGVKTRFVMELIRLSVLLNEKVLIFSQYLKPLELLQDQVARAFHWNVGTEIMVIDGRITQVHRQAIFNDFNDPNGKGKVLLASTRCCSEGIHLYGASRVVLLDVVWNPSVESQAISRAYRLGQKKVVYTYHLIAGTTEEDKYNQQVEKARVAEMVFSSGSMASAEVSRKVTLDDKILQHMLDHQELKHMFKKIRYPENQPRV
uniref:SNF2 domain-containing protein CLASSY 3-like n=1 Tax=Erigeron canadensis TaxID=72917 RepID=UPI001CB9749E|nr:SNF2 domain-containing protein CLASSY 3-like [Erigeron canadensis]